MATLRISLITCPEGRDCQRAGHRNLKAAARAKKPHGYTWRMWNDPKAGRPIRRKFGPLRTPAWAYPIAAYKVDVPYPTEVERARVARIRDWAEAKGLDCGDGRGPVDAEAA